MISVVIQWPLSKRSLTIAAWLFQLATCNGVSPTLFWAKQSIVSRSSRRRIYLLIDDRYRRGKEQVHAFHIAWIACPMEWCVTCFIETQNRGLKTQIRTHRSRSTSEPFTLFANDCWRNSIFPRFAASCSALTNFSVLSSTKSMSIKATVDRWDDENTVVSWNETTSAIFIRRR